MSQYQRDQEAQHPADTRDFTFCGGPDVPQQPPRVSSQSRRLTGFLMGKPVVSPWEALDRARLLLQ